MPQTRTAFAVPLTLGTREHGPYRWLALLVAVPVLLLALSFVPGGLRYLANSWPEWCLLLALTGMLAWGVSIAGLLLAVFGIGARVFWAARLLLHALLAVGHPTNDGGSSSLPKPV